MRMILSTCRSEEAEMIADDLLDAHLVASVNIVPVTTKVRFKGEALTQEESLLIMRTRDELVWRVEKRIRQLNSYELPEVAALEIREFNKAFAEWVRAATANPRLSTELPVQKRDSPTPADKPAKAEPASSNDHESGGDKNP